MNLSFDMSEYSKVRRAAKGFATSMDKTALKASMRKALRPMLQHTKITVPIDKRVKKYKRSYLGRARKSNARDKGYDRGGATKRDLRIKVGDAKGKMSWTSEVAGLVGVSKKRTRVGWRTHLITRGRKAGVDRIGRNFSAIAPRDFLAPAYQAGSGQLHSSISTDVLKKAAKMANSI
jgi:hypothetical protein